MHWKRKNKYTSYWRLRDTFDVFVVRSMNCVAAAAATAAGWGQPNEPLNMIAYDKRKRAVLLMFI